MYVSKTYLYAIKINWALFHSVFFFFFLSVKNCFSYYFLFTDISVSIRVQSRRSWDYRRIFLNTVPLSRRVYYLWFIHTWCVQQAASERRRHRVFMGLVFSIYVSTPQPTSLTVQYKWIYYAPVCYGSWNHVVMSYLHENTGKNNCL